MDLFILLFVRSIKNQPEGVKKKKKAQKIKVESDIDFIDRLSLSDTTSDSEDNSCNSEPMISSSNNNNGRTDIQTVETPFACDWPECNQLFTKRCFLTIHKKKHAAKKRQSILISHKRIPVGEKSFVCDWPNCEKRYTRNDSLNTHKKIHKREKRINDLQKIKLYKSIE